MNVKLVWITDSAEQTIVDCARVSNPNNKGKDGTKLIEYLIAHNHWSPFEMSSACFEIITSRAISRQILRHRSFSFQEFSQRYAEVPTFEHVEPRKQAKKNRQSSTDDLDENDKAWFQKVLKVSQDLARATYQEALQRGIARESARFLLPETAESRLYMTGTLRSWIHYVQLRIQEDTQLEHRVIASHVKELLQQELPTIGEFL